MTVGDGGFINVIEVNLGLQTDPTINIVTTKLDVPLPTRRADFINENSGLLLQIFPDGPEGVLGFVLSTRFYIDEEDRVILDSIDLSTLAEDLKRAFAWLNEVGYALQGSEYEFGKMFSGYVDDEFRIGFIDGTDIVYWTDGFAPPVVNKGVLPGGDVFTAPYCVENVLVANNKMLCSGASAEFDAGYFMNVWQIKKNLTEASWLSKFRFSFNKDGRTSLGYKDSVMQYSDGKLYIMIDRGARYTWGSVLSISYDDGKTWDYHCAANDFIEYTNNAMDGSYAIGFNQNLCATRPDGTVLFIGGGQPGKPSPEQVFICSLKNLQPNNSLALNKIFVFDKNTRIPSYQYPQQAELLNGIMDGSISAFVRPDKTTSGTTDTTEIYKVDGASVEYNNTTNKISKIKLTYNNGNTTDTVAYCSAAYLKWPIF